MTMQKLPRRVVGTYLSVARLPLTTVARVSGQKDNEQWPPALAFEGLEASVETTLGSLLRNDELLESGRMRRAKVAQLRKAARLEAVAESKRGLAQQEVRETRAQAAAKRKAADERADNRLAQLEQQAAQQKAQTEQQAVKKSAAAEQTKAAQEKVIERRERATKAEALAEESEALKTKQEALDAAETADVIDETIEGSKEARHTG